MKFLTDLLDNKDILNKLGNSVGADASQVEKLTELGIPVLLEGLGRNSSTPDGAEALTKALDQHQGDNIEDLEVSLGNVNLDEGAKILSHIFSGDNDKVQNNLATETGLDKNQVSGLLSQLAPLLMGVLGQEKKTQNIDISGISDLLNSFMGKNTSSKTMDMVKNLLDSDNDGSIVDDVGNIIGGFFKKK